MSEKKGTTHSDDSVRPRQYIFVDANVLIPMFTGSDTSGLDTLRVVSQVGRAHLLTTEITRIETVKNLAEKDCDIIRPVDNNRFRERVRELMNIRLPVPDMRTLYLKAYSRHMEEVQTKTSGRFWECLDTSDTDLQNIFSQYGEKRGLFSDRTKKHQFADAIVFEQLKHTAAFDTPVYIYSRDNDFISAARDTPNIEHARTWKDLLLLLEMDENIEEVTGLVEAYETTIVEEVSESIDSRFSNSLRHSMINASNYVSSVESKLGVSIKFKHRIVVSGTVLVTYCFPYPLPVPFGVAWNEDMTRYSENELERTEYCFEVSLLAISDDFRKTGIGQDQRNLIMDGNMMLEIEGLGHFVGYRIIRLIWPLS